MKRLFPFVLVLLLLCSSCAIKLEHPPNTPPTSTFTTTAVPSDCTVQDGLLIRIVENTLQVLNATPVTPTQRIVREAYTTHYEDGSRVEYDLHFFLWEWQDAVHITPVDPTAPWEAAVQADGVHFFLYPPTGVEAGYHLIYDTEKGALHDPLTENGIHGVTSSLLSPDGTRYLLLRGDLPPMVYDNATFLIQELPLPSDWIGWDGFWADNDTLLFTVCFADDTIRCIAYAVGSGETSVVYQATPYRENGGGFLPLTGEYGIQVAANGTAEAVLKRRGVRTPIPDFTYCAEDVFRADTATLYYFEQTAAQFTVKRLSLEAVGWLSPWEIPLTQAVTAQAILDEQSLLLTFADNSRTLYTFP